MKLLRKILIRLGIWGYFYPPHNILGVKVHRDWPWIEKRRLKANEIVSVQPMTGQSSLKFQHDPLKTDLDIWVPVGHENCDECNEITDKWRKELDEK